MTLEFYAKAPTEELLARSPNGAGDLSFQLHGTDFSSENGSFSYVPDPGRQSMMLTLSGKPLDLSNNGAIRSIPELCDATLILQGAGSVVENLLDHLEPAWVVINFSNGEQIRRKGPFPVVKRRDHTAYRISLKCGR